MKLLRSVMALMIVIGATLALTSEAVAVAPNATEALAARMRLHDKTFGAMPSMSLDQRWLQITALSAFELGITDLEVIMDAYLSAEVLVTYYLHAETTWVWTGSAWDISYRTLYDYTDGNLTEILEQDWNGSEWVNLGRQLQTYDGSNRLSTMQFQMWSGTDWTVSSRLVYSYDGSGVITQVLNQSWQSNAWVDTQRYIPTYSGTRLESNLTQNWTGSAWVDAARVSYTYNGADQVTVTLSETWSGSAWVGTSRTTNTYVDGNLTETVSETWDGSQWNNTNRRVRTYNGQDQELTSTGYVWATGAWSLQDSDTSTYTAGRLSESVHVVYSFFNSVTRTQYNYDGAGNLIETIMQFDFFGTLQPASRTTFYYTTSGVFDGDASSELPATFSLDQNYPNPFNLTTVIPYSLARDNHVKITVANILGQTVSTLVDEFQFGGTHTAVWEGRNAHGADVTSGVYFFRVQVGALTQTRKMVLLK